MKRPPIVVIMGHVDHGKTTLLDYIRKSNVAGKEAGGITQSVGAYEIEHSGQRITFIDTPGHEAFMTMRQRGAAVADLGILVVAADDGVQKQTKEAFAILQETKTPCIVAINKIDKAGTDLNRLKNDLAQAGILLEGYGGNISWQAISAKTGQSVNELLDLIILAADLENLTYEPTAPASGFILESQRGSARGITVSAIVKNGVLKMGDTVYTPTTQGKLKSLENFLGKRIKEANPSSPILMLGFEELPKIGDEFSTEKITVEQAETKKNMPMATDEATRNFVLKADTSGSLEVLSSIIKNLSSEKARPVVIEESIGDITDGDVKSAIAHQAMIIGFRVKTNNAAENLIKVHSVKVISSEIIYELIKAIEDELKSLGQTIILGDLEILATFGRKGGNKQIVGGRVVSGEIKNNSVLEVQRRDQVLGTGRIVNLQQAKADVKKVDSGQECGLLFDSKIEVAIGDHLISK